MTEEKKTTRKKIAAAEFCKKVMSDHFHEMDEAAKTGSRKIAWCTSVGPAELLRGMGFLVFYFSLGAFLWSGQCPFSSKSDFFKKASHPVQYNPVYFPL